MFCFILILQFYFVNGYDRNLYNSASLFSIPQWALITELRVNFLSIFSVRYCIVAIEIVWGGVLLARMPLPRFLRRFGGSFNVSTYSYCYFFFSLISMSFSLWTDGKKCVCLYIEKVTILSLLPLFFYVFRF